MRPANSHREVNATLDKFRLDGKVAVVCGVGPEHGVGWSMARTFADAGADVCVVARSAERIEKVAGEIAALGRRAIPIQADLTDSAQVDGMVSRAMEELGRVDVFCNHGMTSRGLYYGPTLSIDNQSWEAMLTQVLTSVMYLNRAAGRVLVDQGNGGSIINTSSLASIMWRVKNINLGSTAYGVAKAGLNHLTRSVAAELGPHGIRVNALLMGTFENAVSEGHVADDFTRYWLSETPLQRLGRTEEVAMTALFLASEASSYITGQLIRIDGGFAA